MRNWNQYFELWQQKRDELHVDIDVQADWSEMHDQLDKYLPIENPGSGGSNTSGQASNLVKQLSQLIKFKLFYIVGGLILAGAVTYYVMQHRAAIKNNKAVKTEIRKDSVATHNVLATDSLSASNSNPAADSPGNHQSSSSDAIPPANALGKGDVNTGRAAINNKVDASSKNTGANSGSANNNRILSSSNNLTNGLRLNSNGRSGSNTHLGNNNRRINVNSNNPAGMRRDLIAGNNGQNSEAGGSGSIATDNRRDYNTPLLITSPSTTILSWDDIVAGNKFEPGIIGKYIPAKSLSKNYTPPRLLSKNAKPVKAAKNSMSNKNSSGRKRSTGGGNSIFNDWDLGILAGVNSNGGFTPKEQNHNIYGSLSPDIYLGVFGNYNLNDHWALGFQGKFLVPHAISGTYNYTHKLSADTSHTTQTLIISDSRKVYTVDVPVHVIYKATPNISLKAGAVVSLPVKQINGTNSFIITGPLRDSAVYYNSVTNDINASRFDKKIRVGASVGIGFAYKALWLDATYNFQGQKVNSALGSYNANANSLQLTIGIKFNKSKK